MANWQDKNSDLKSEQVLALQLAKKFDFTPSLPTLADLKRLLTDNYVVGVNVNYYPLYEKPGYSGHFILVLAVGSKYVHIHDPGLPPKPNQKILIENFVKAWEYPTKDSRNYQAFKKA